MVSFGWPRNEMWRESSGDEERAWLRYGVRNLLERVRILNHMTYQILLKQGGPFGCPKKDLQAGRQREYILRRKGLKLAPLRLASDGNTVYQSLTL